MLTLAVLGPVEVRRDGTVTRVPGGKVTELLVRLALEAGSPVRAERLLDDLWPALDHHAAPNTLQSKVSKLRGALGGQAVRGDDAGYTLMVDPANVDATQALRLAEQAAALRATADAQGALALCERALSLFHGDVLPGAGDSPWANPYRARLETTRLRLVEDRVASQADLGVAEGLISELENLVAAHPLRERLWASLVTALYRSGRQGDALAASRKVRRLLADELGVDPGPELQRLEQQVLDHDPVLVLPAPTSPVARSPRPGNLLPLPRSSLVGRTEALHRVEDALREQRHVTLTGPAGVGKTRLAMELAGRCELSGGVWVARLETAVDAVSIWRSIGEALAIDAPTRASVTERLNDGELLLVLDNCEHVAAAVADTVDALLAAAPRLRLLATSQVPLRCPAEYAINVDPLTVADAVTLFADRAQAQRPDQPDDDETRATIESMCRSLDGLPLAIELAAARTKVLPIQEIARRLQDRFTLLRDPTSHLPARHSTLRAAVAWSYDLLFPDDQRGLWALAAFTGGAPLSGLETVLTSMQVPKDAGLDIITRLVDRSLATADIRPRGPARYHLLDSVRAFGLEKLQEAGLADAAAAAHAHWYAEAADHARIALRGPGQAEHLNLARADRANIDAALAWCAAHDPGAGVRIVLGFGWAWVLMGTGVEGADKVRAALAAASPTNQDHAAALTLCGWFEASGGNLERARSDLHDAIRIGDERAGAIAQVHLAFVHTQGGQAAQALALLDACQDDLARFDLVWEQAASFLLGAWAHLALGDLAAGQAACSQALALLRPVQDSWALAHAEGLLGELAGAQHRFMDAVAHLTSAAHAAENLGFEAAQAHHLLNLGRALQQAGDRPGSRTILERAIVIAQRCGDARTAAYARTRLAQVLRATGDTRPALASAQQAVDWYNTAGGGDGAALANYLLAALHADTDILSARDELTRVLEQARTGADAVTEVLTLDTLAALDARHGRAEVAEAERAAADCLAAATPTLWPGDLLTVPSAS